MLSRRELLATTAVFAVLPRFAFAAETAAASEAGKFDALMTAFF